jgi:hypothetical protein
VGLTETPLAVIVVVSAEYPAFARHPARLVAPAAELEFAGHALTAPPSM